MFASGSDDNTIKLWDTIIYQEIITLKGHTEGVNSVCFSSDCRVLASGSDDKTIKIWNIVTYEEITTLWKGLALNDSY